MNDSDREDWVSNDEGLYDMAQQWLRRNKGGMRAFLREHREVIDEVVGQVTTGHRRPGYLKYG